MQKIKCSVLEKMIEAGVTSKEFDFLIYISRFQDESGRVSGVYYKEVCEKMNMSYQGFYDTKKSLVEKGLIYSNKNSEIDHDITIVGNSYYGVTDLKKVPYVSTYHNIFMEKEFFKLKVGAKLLAMRALNLSRMGRGTMVIGIDKFYKEYPKAFGVTKRVMRNYLMQLKPFFTIILRNGKYHIIPISEKVYAEKVKNKNEIDKYRENEVKVICRRKGMDVSDEKEIEETAKFVRQYQNKAVKAGHNVWQVIKIAIDMSLEKLNERYETYKVREIKHRVIHIMIKKILKKGISEEEGYIFA